MTNRRPKKRRFFIISYSLRHKLADFEVENLDVLLEATRGLYAPELGHASLYPPPGQRGFPSYSENPQVVIGKRRQGPPPSDIELYHSYWLISDRLKTVFETVDSSAFAFQVCDVKLRDGSPGPIHWLCDVIRVQEALDKRTLLEMHEYRRRTGWYPGFLLNREALGFDEAAIGDSHIFRMPQSSMEAFCDQTMKDACRAAGLKGIRFAECGNRPRPLPMPRNPDA